LIRPVTAADADAIAAFFAAAHRLDPLVGAISVEDWRRFVALPQNRGGRDFRIAEAGGGIAGVATPSLRDHETPWVRHFRIVVAPELRRRGIASLLLRELAVMDPPERAILQSLCPERWGAMSGFLAACGFAVLEHELEMVCEDADAAAERGSGREALVRVADAAAPLAAAFAEALAAIHNRAYAGSSSFARLTGPEMAALLAGNALLVIAEDRGKIVGYCHLALGNAESWIESLAVAPDRQRAGIGGALMARALGEAASRAGRRVRLTVSDRNAAAYVLYRRLGFDVVAKSTRWRAERHDVLAALERRGR
jgi:ribosomal protein S18 acetylase RimI-like enzyme